MGLQNLCIIGAQNRWWSSSSISMIKILHFLLNLVSELRFPLSFLFRLRIPGLFSTVLAQKSLNFRHTFSCVPWLAFRLLNWEAFWKNLDYFWNLFLCWWNFRRWWKIKVVEFMFFDCFLFRKANDGGNDGVSPHRERGSNLIRIIERCLDP